MPEGLFVIEVFVHPRHRNQGLAKAGLVWLATTAQKNRLETQALRVESENIGAMDLYRGLDFTEWRAQE